MAVDILKTFQTACKTSANHVRWDIVSTLSHLQIYPANCFFGCREGRKYQLDLVTIGALLTDHSDVAPARKRGFESEITPLADMVVDFLQH